MPAARRSRTGMAPVVASTWSARVSVVAGRAVGGVGVISDIGRDAVPAQRVAPGLACRKPCAVGRGGRAGKGAVPNGSSEGRDAWRVRAGRGVVSAASRARRSVANSSDCFRSGRCWAWCEPMEDPHPGARHRAGSMRRVPALAGAALVGSCRRAGEPGPTRRTARLFASGRRSDRNHPVTMIGSPRLGTAPIEPSRAMSGRRWRPFGVIRRGVRTSSAAQAAERAARRSDSTPSDGPGSLHAPSSAVHVRPS